MGLNMTMKEFSKTIENDARSKRDYWTSLDKMKMDYSGNLVNGNFRLKLNDTAINQLANKTNAKGLALYAKTLRDRGQYARLSSLFNYHIKDELKYRESLDKKSDMLIRSKDGICRAVLTNKYEIIDNESIKDILEKKLENRDVSITNCKIDEDYMNVRIKFNDLEYNDGKSPLYPCIHVKNSEVGLSSLFITAVLYRQICSNGMVTQLKEGKTISKRHFSNQFVDELIDESIIDCIDSVEHVIKPFLKTKEEGP